MSKIRIDPQDWVVVCDGSKWLILENKGDAEYVNLVVREDRKDDNPPTHAQGSERPGRAHQSVGAGRSAVGQTDWHDQAEQHFLKALAARLNAAAEARETKALVLVAPPRAMGVLRPALSAQAGALVRDVLDKDYVNLPIDRIEKYLAGG